MDLSKLPGPALLKAVSEVMGLACANGLRGMGGECGEVAVAMKRTLFDGNAEIVAGLNKAFLQHGDLIGHFAVQIPFGLDEVRIFDESGVAISYDCLESWGMLAPDDLDYADRAIELGFHFDDAAAEEVSLLIFDSEEDVLTNMPGSGLAAKVDLLQQAMSRLGYVTARVEQAVIDEEEEDRKAPSM